MDKKHLQLGMNPSTANGRLIKDLLFAFVIKDGHKCFRCGDELTRETFSIEHTIPWLDSENPVELFFDLKNIAFSHLSCNAGAARRNLAACGTYSAYTRGCRCDLCREASALQSRKNYKPEYRQARHKKLLT